MEEYAVDNIIHYIMSNNGSLGITWTNQNIEGTIQGALSVEEAKEMINSIYEE